MRSVVWRILPVAGLLVASPSIAENSIQQDFESAQAALDGENMPVARRRFEALLKRMPTGSKSRSTAVVKARLASTLIAGGEQEAAIPLLDDSIATFVKPTPEDKAERIAALYDRARATEAIGLFARAAADYQEVISLEAPEKGSAKDVQLRSSLARSLIWTDAPEARKLLDGLLAEPGPVLGASKDSLALIYSLRARVELNHGKPEAALPFLQKAASEAGGTRSLRLNLTDARVRSDLAITYHLMKRFQKQQELVAYSGGGTAESREMANPASMELPSCGPASGLAPEDVAVVEFAVAEDGRAHAVTPIYVRRGDGRDLNGKDGVEAQFVQAARSWTWRPDKLSELKPFWRLMQRVELRCSNSRPTHDMSRASLYSEWKEEVARLGVQPQPSLPENDASALPIIRSEIARRSKTEGHSKELALMLLALASNDSAMPKERIDAFGRAGSLLQGAGVPQGAIVPIRVDALQLAYRQTSMTSSGLISGLQQMLDVEARDRPDARSTNYLRLVIARQLQDNRKPDQASALLNRIVATPIDLLGRVDPIRTEALLRQSNIAAARNDMSTAAQAFDATGLSPEQCALVDVKPVSTNNMVAQTEFPREAMMWRTDGRTRVEYDIATDGTTANVRILMASPPFVFGDATAKAATRFRYSPVFRPGNELGCQGQVHNFQFMAN